MEEQNETETEIIDDPFGEQRRMENERRKEMNAPEETDKIVTEMWERNYEPTVKDTEWLMREINEVLDGFFYKSTPDVAKFYEVGLREEIGGLIEEMEELEESSVLGDPIKPDHYRKGEIDLYESWYRTRPFNEFRAIMESIAERYIKRDKENRVEDIEKAIYTLERLKEYEEYEKEKNKSE